jgi:hypothetical protein
MTFLSKPMHQSQSGLRYSGATAGKAVRACQARQSTFLKATLVSPHGADRAVKGPGDLGLSRPALLHQAHHGVSGGQAVRDRVLGEDDAGDHHHAMTILPSQQAPIVDDAGALRIARVRKPVSIPSRCHSGLNGSRGQKKRTGLGPQWGDP